MTAADLQHFADQAWQGANAAIVFVLIAVLAMVIRLAFRSGR